LRNHEPEEQEEYKLTLQDKGLLGQTVHSIHSKGRLNATFIGKIKRGFS